MISISSSNAPCCALISNEYNKIWDVLYLKFNDTDSVNSGITMEQAYAIKDFVFRHIGLGVDRLIVHCEAGQSRSAGVAAAIMKVLYNDDTAIFDDRRYTPNMLCYRTVLNAFMN